MLFWMTVSRTLSENIVWFTLLLTLLTDCGYNNYLEYVNCKVMMVVMDN